MSSLETLENELPISSLIPKEQFRFDVNHRVKYTRKPQSDEIDSLLKEPRN